MNLLGVHLTLLIGPDPVAVPAPLPVMEALSEVEVVHSDRERSGFRVTFTAGRSGPFDLVEDPLLANPAIAVNSRVVVVITFDVVPQVLIDGLVTRRDVIPGDEPGAGRIVLTGHDITLALERSGPAVAHPAQDETVIAAKIIASYPQYGLIPVVIPPPVIDPPLPVDRTPLQLKNDHAFLKQMAERYGYVFYIVPGPAPLTNTAYWGPPLPQGLPQKALSVKLGSESNVTAIQLGNDGQAPETVEAYVMDRITGQIVPVITVASTRPPLGALPDYVRHSGNLRSRPMNTSGLNIAQAFGRAQGRFDRSTDDSFTVSGTLDTLRYNGVLRARAEVDLRGAGLQHNGTYRVRRVTHTIRSGSYTQDFTLSRGESLPKSPIVRVV